MAKISELPAVADPTGTETVVVLADGETKQVPMEKLAGAALALRIKEASEVLDVKVADAAASAVAARNASARVADVDVRDWAFVWGDASRKFSTGIADDGTFMTIRSRLLETEIDRATIGGSSLAGTLRAKGFGQVWGDSRGYFSAGVRHDGLFVMRAAEIHELTGIASINGVPFDQLGAGGGGDTGSDAALYGARNSANLRASAQVKGAVNSVVAALAYDFCHYIINGQSLSNGFETWPALSKANRFASNMMIGQSVRPATDQGTPFAPLGGSAAFQPLVAVVQSTTGALLDDAAVAALPAGNNAQGETPIEGAVNYAKLLHNQRHGLLDDPGRVFVATSVGVGGQKIAVLQKGASTGYFTRFTGALEAAAANVATMPGKTIGLVAYVWQQGEYDYTGQGSGAAANTDVLMVGAMETHWADVRAEVGRVYGQAVPPAFFCYQTSGHFTRDDHQLGVGMGQWAFTRAAPGRYLYAPSYPVTDKTDHFDANGARWMGMQLGKVMHRVLELRQEWKPLSPRSVTQAGRRIAIDFHVPEPPLVFDRPYLVNAIADYASKGFRVTDGTGEVPIAGIRIVFETIVEILLDRDTTGTVLIWYASQTGSAGNGCLRDSDATQASEIYEYAAGSGQYASANIPALVGKPYPLWNWCIAFCVSPGFTA